MNAPFGKPRRRWEDNITIYLRKLGWEGGEWIHLDQVRNQWEEGGFL
jgi:hypothetical protein